LSQAAPISHQKLEDLGITKSDSSRWQPEIMEYLSLFRLFDLRETRSIT
jgi:hypothetical protein